MLYCRLRHRRHRRAATATLFVIVVGIVSNAHNQCPLKYTSSILATKKFVPECAEPDNPTRNLKRTRRRLQGANIESEESDGNQPGPRNTGSTGERKNHVNLIVYDCGFASPLSPSYIAYDLFSTGEQQWCFEVGPTSCECADNTRAIQTRNRRCVFSLCLF